MSSSSKKKAKQKEWQHWHELIKNMTFKEKAQRKCAYNESVQKSLRMKMGVEQNKHLQKKHEYNMRNKGHSRNNRDHDTCMTNKNSEAITHDE